MADGSLIEQREVVQERLSIAADEYTKQEEFEVYWRTELAPFLLNKVWLVIAGRKHRLLELEFYFTSKHHDDPYTHCSEEQQQSAIWYFHKMGSGYKGGSYKGLDIAIGQGEESKGGVLIRSLQEVDGEGVVCGPSLCVDHILRMCGASSIASFVEEGLQSSLTVLEEPDIDRPLHLTLREKGDLEKEIFLSPRIGLGLKKKGYTTEQCSGFVFRNYRALTHPQLIKKGKHLLAISMKRDVKTLTEICEAVASKPAAVGKWLSAYEEGRKLAVYETFIGVKLNVSGLCEAIGAVDGFVRDAAGGSKDGHSSNTRVVTKENGDVVAIRIVGCQIVTEPARPFGGDWEEKEREEEEEG